MSELTKLGDKNNWRKNQMSKKLTMTPLKLKSSKQTNRKRTNNENFQNEIPETADPPNDAITVEEDPNERPCSESSKKGGSSSQSDNVSTEIIKTKNQNKKNEKAPARKKVRVSDQYRNSLLPMRTISIQMAFLLQETRETQ